MSRFRPEMRILPPNQKALWPSLRGSTELGLVLYGGTAVGLRLGHRTSLDFDFFKQAPLDREALSRTFPFLAQSKVLQDAPNTLTILALSPIALSETVKISFFGGIDFGRVGTPQLTDDGVLEVASLADLMATKLKVVLQRLEAKDYKDIAAMLRAGVSLDRGLAAARMMYAPTFQPSESLKALTYFAGGDLHDLSQSDREALVQAVRNVRDLPEVELSGKELSATDVER